MDPAQQCWLEKGHSAVQIYGEIKPCSHILNAMKGEEVPGSQFLYSQRHKYSCGGALFSGTRVAIEC